MTNSRALGLALKKQRLQLASTQLRDEFSRHAAVFVPIFDGADRAVAGARWLRSHPQILLALAAGFLLTRPPGRWRWLRRVFVGWQVWRRVRDLIDSFPVSQRAAR